MCVYVHTHTHKMDYSVVKKNEILLSATTLVDLESIMLNKVSQRKTNITRCHPYMEFSKERKRHTKKDLTIENRWVPEGKWVGMGETGEGDSVYSYPDEHRVIYLTVESLHCTPEANLML